MTQPTALFLADILEDAGKPADIAEKAAAELRRLHAELERCKQVCAATSERWRSDTDVWKAQRDALLAARTALKAALAEPVQEPVAYSVGRTLHWHEGKGVNDAQLYLAPPQRKPLSTEQILDLFDSHNVYGTKWVEFARAVERAHGIT